MKTKKNKKKMKNKKKKKKKKPMNKMPFLILKEMNGNYQNINLKFVFILINIVFQNIN